MLNPRKFHPRVPSYGSEVPSCAPTEMAKLFVEAFAVEYLQTKSINHIRTRVRNKLFS